MMKQMKMKISNTHLHLTTTTLLLKRIVTTTRYLYAFGSGNPCTAAPGGQP